MLYLIDFGISSKYIDSSGKVFKPRMVKNIRCSPQYAGVNQLDGMSKQFYQFTPLALCRKDDIESIFYTMLSLLKINVKQVSSYHVPYNSNSFPIQKEDPQQKSLLELQKIKTIKENISISLANKLLPGTFILLTHQLVALSSLNTSLHSPPLTSPTMTSSFSVLKKKR